MTQEALKLKELDQAASIEKMKMKHQSDEKAKDRAANFLTSSIGNAGNIAKIVAAAAKNDPAFYFPDASELAQVCCVNGDLALGGDHLSESTCDSARIPGICVAKTINAIPFTESANDGINPALRTLYKKIRGQNYGDITYQFADMGNMLIAISEIFSYYAWMKRAYGLMSAAASPKNRYWAFPALRAEGWSEDEIDSNVARINLLNSINRVANILHGFVVPSDFSYFARSMVQYIAVYKEREDEYSQLYLRRPYGFYHWDVAESKLNLQTLPTGLTVSFVNQRVLSMIDDLVNVPSYNKMQAEMLRAYGDNTFAPEKVDYEFSTVPVFDPDALAMFQNATVFDSEKMILGNLNITQENSSSSSYLKFAPTVTFDSEARPLVPFYSGARYIHYMDREPTPAALIEAVQMASFIETTATDLVYKVKPFGTLVMDVYLYQLASPTGAVTSAQVNRGFTSNGLDTFWTYLWSAFYYAPCFPERTGSNLSNYVSIAKYDRVSVLTKSQAQSMIDALCFNLFDSRSAATQRKPNKQ